MMFQNIKVGDVVLLVNGSRETITQVGNSLFMSDEGGWFFSGKPLAGRKEPGGVIKILKKEEYPEEYL